MRHNASSLDRCVPYCCCEVADDLKGGADGAPLKHCCGARAFTCGDECATECAACGACCCDAREESMRRRHCCLTACDCVSYDDGCCSAVACTAFATYCFPCCCCCESPDDRGIGLLTLEVGRDGVPCKDRVSFATRK
jgi:hypothetical protein